MANAYDLMAPHYREYAEKKSAYMTGVDDFILSNLPEHIESLLDVGAGDGIRGMALAGKIGVDKVILCEPSEKMAEFCKQLNPSDVWQCRADELPIPSEMHFDIITCLWNVMGHIPDYEARVASLKSMARMLATGGRIFMDVNNRHNANAYGFWTVSVRRFLDCIKPDYKRGDVKFEWDINGQKIPASGHLFTVAEMRGIIKDAGLRIVKTVAVDYLNGAISNDITKGQMVFVLEKGDIT